MADQAYLEIVESIYDAATDPSLWPVVLERLAAPSRGKAFMSLRDPAKPPQSWPVLYAGMEQSWLSALSEHYSARVPWMQTAIPRRRPGIAVPSEHVIRRADLLKTEFYSDFLRPQGLISGIGVTVARDGGRLVSAGLLVPLEAEPRHAEHVALVQRVAPHLERALRVNHQLSRADFRWQAAEETFDRLAVGVVLLSADMTVRFANAEAERVLGQQDGLGRDREGRLLAGCSDDDKRLRASVRSLAGNLQATADRGGVLRIRRRSEKRPYSVLIAAARPPAGLLERDERNAILFISEGRSREPSREQLAATFGLTLAESRLLQVLLQGHGLTEAADQLGNSVNTAKTHLRALFEKLDCSRQSDLVRTVTSHPVWLAGGGTSRSR